MNDEGRAEDAVTPAEERLTRLLALLRVELRDGAELPQAIVRRARWQLIVRSFARTVADIAGAVAGGVAVLLGLGSGSRRG